MVARREMDRLLRPAERQVGADSCASGWKRKEVSGAARFDQRAAADHRQEHRLVSSQPGPETADATGDPIVITRYLYKPTAGEGNSHFNDNKRLHIFVADVAS